MISFAITACTEHVELDKLLNILTHNIHEDDEIIVQVDLSTVTPEVLSVIDNFEKVRTIEYTLDRDFAAFKNNLNANCTKRWIFNIDADEVPSQNLLDQLHELLTENELIDSIYVPRWNVVSNISRSQVVQWNWKLDEHNRINWPDFQCRIYKNNPNIKWVGAVHETLTGFDSCGHLPCDAAQRSLLFLLHEKTIEKQATQNALYEGMAR